MTSSSYDSNNCELELKALPEIFKSGNILRSSS